MGAMTYPAPWTLNRLFFKTPLIWWRMGLGPALGSWMLVLTTWGRRSRLPRHTMLSYTPCNGRVYLISGWGSRADWHQNITADPHVTVQRGRGAHSALARRVTGMEEYAAVMGLLLQTGGDTHFRPWLKSLDIAYDLDDLIAKRDRVYMVALDPTGESGPPPMPADLTWVWGVIAGSFAVRWWLGRSSRPSTSPEV
jgi:deazaflavin-dependent oxidoreductase (nitroreductase family)